LVTALNSFIVYGLSPIASIVNASDCTRDKLLGYGVGVIAGVDVAVAVMLTVGVKVGWRGCGLFRRICDEAFQIINSAGVHQIDVLLAFFLHIARGTGSQSP